MPDGYQIQYFPWMIIFFCFLYICVLGADDSLTKMSKSRVSSCYLGGKVNVSTLSPSVSKHAVVACCRESLSTSGLHILYKSDNALSGRPVILGGVFYQYIL